jgi:hypothetical protein
MTFILKEEDTGVGHYKDGCINSSNLKTGWNLSQGLNLTGDEVHDDFKFSYTLH